MEDDQELLQIIPILLGCRKENVVEGNFVEITIVRGLLDLMKETAYSHLMEVGNLPMGSTWKFHLYLFFCHSFFSSFFVFLCVGI